MNKQYSYVSLECFSCVRLLDTEENSQFKVYFLMLLVKYFTALWVIYLSVLDKVDISGDCHWLMRSILFAVNILLQYWPMFAWFHDWDGRLQCPTKHNIFQLLCIRTCHNVIIQWRMFYYFVSWSAIREARQFPNSSIFQKLNTYYKCIIFA